MNAIAVFVISGMLAKTLGLLGWQAPLFRGVFLPLASPVNASLLYAVANVALMWLIAYGMYRRGWFVRF
jgi:predicted acyltransferase